jgi:hypothetical protein
VRPPSADDSTATGVLETEPFRATVDAAFRTDEIIAEAVKANLKPRTVAAEAIRKRADLAFKDFTHSSYAEEERARSTYLATGDDLPKVLEEIATTRSKDLGVAGGTLAIRLTDGGAIDSLITKRVGGDGSTTVGTIKVADLVENLPQRLEAAAATAVSWPVCDGEDEAAHPVSGRPTVLAFSLELLT